MSLKANVNAFDQDIALNDGYLYTTKARYSSKVADERLTRAVLDHMRPTDLAVVDVGCGDGTFTNEIVTHRPHVRVSALDPAKLAIERAKEKYPDVDFAVGDILDETTLPSRSYDLVILRGVLHHLADPARALHNAAKLSHRIIIIEPNGLNPILKFIEKRSAYHIEHEEQSFAPGLIVRWCREAGLDVSVCKFAGFVPMFFPTGPARVIHFFQPLLERLPLVNRYFSAVSIIVTERAVA